MLKTILFLLFLAFPVLCQLIYPAEMQRKVDSLADAIQRLERAQEADRDRASEVGNTAIMSIGGSVVALLVVITILGVINYKASKSDFDSFAIKAETNLKQVASTEIDDIRKQYHDHLKILREQSDSIAPTLKKAVESFENKTDSIKEEFNRYLKGLNVEFLKGHSRELIEIEAQIQIRVWTKLGHINLALQWYASLYNNLDLLERLRADISKLSVIASGLVTILLEAQKQGYSFTANDMAVRKDTEHLYSYFKQAGISFFSTQDVSAYIGYKQ
jgi:DNA anti-recombination protein RmuC